MAFVLWFYLSFLNIRVLPHVVMSGQAVRVTCLVQHRSENRKLIMQIEGYRTSEWTLDGDAAPGVFEVIYEHVPCDVSTASCTLIEDTGKMRVASTPLYVGGC